MREIKFRVWNKTLGRFDPAGLPIIHNSEKGIFGVDNSYVEHFVVQQYTGLKDKNGVEIYEGDIIERLLSMPEHEINDLFQYEIIYHNGYIEDGSAGTAEYSIVFSGFAAKATKVCWDEGATRSIGRYPDKENYGICGVAVVDYEVIGNIFEGVDK